jgi:hypothetical protein
MLPLIFAETEEDLLKSGAVSEFAKSPRYYAEVSVKSIT